jgi:hypothetical protein
VPAEADQRQTRAASIAFPTFEASDATTFFLPKGAVEASWRLEDFFAVVSAGMAGFSRTKLE